MVQLVNQGGGTTSGNQAVTYKPGGGASTVIVGPAKSDDKLEEANVTPLENGHSAWLPALLLCMMGTGTWLMGLYLDCTLTPRNAVHYLNMPKTVYISYSFCAVAYMCNLLLNLLKLAFEPNSIKVKLHVLGIYISLLSSATYFLVWAGIASYQLDVNSVAFVPMRWVLYCCTMPAIWWILAHVSTYNLRSKLYVLFLNWVMLIAGALATIPGMNWYEKCFWMMLSCLPFPELCHHMWTMITDAIEAAHETAVEGTEAQSCKALYFIRVYGQFSYQFFPAIYFAAFDGCMPLHMSEPLWALCDWCLKMVMTSSLMEVNFVTITQRHRLAQLALEDVHRLDTIALLREAIERKDDFLSALSHELRTPLNGIIGLSDGLLNGAGGVLTPTVSKTITTIKMSGRRLLHLINDILDAAKVKFGQVMIKHERVNLELLIEDVMDLTIPLVKKGVTMKSRIQHVPLITGDNSRILQILYNLVGNACKFTQKGEIVIMTGMSENGNRVYIAVRDTGIGIPPDRLHTIFAPYSQSDKNVMRHFGGTGLGLHFVRELVHAHNGQIELESRLGVGSTFSCWFPLEQPPQDPGTNKSSSDTGDELGDERGLMLTSTTMDASLIDSAEKVPPAKPMTVLILEHTQEGRERITKMLKEHYKVLTACDMQDMLRVLKSMERRPGAILIDCDVQDEGGIGGIQHIMQKYHKEQLPLIFVSGDEDMLKRLRSIQESSQHVTVLEKPYTQTSLEAAIGEAKLLDLEDDEKACEMSQVQGEVILLVMDFSALTEMTQLLTNADNLLILLHIHELMQQLRVEHGVFHLTVSGTTYVLLLRMNHLFSEDTLVDIVNGLQEIMHEIQSFTSTFAYPLQFTVVIHSGSCHMFSFKDTEESEMEPEACIVSPALWFAQHIAVAAQPGLIIVTAPIVPYLSKVALATELVMINPPMPGGEPIGVTVVAKGNNNWKDPLAALVQLDMDVANKRHLLSSGGEQDDKDDKDTKSAPAEAEMSDQGAAAAGEGEAAPAPAKASETLFLPEDEVVNAKMAHLVKMHEELASSRADIEQLLAQISSVQYDLQVAQRECFLEVGTVGGLPPAQGVGAVQPVGAMPAAQGVVGAQGAWPRSSLMQPAVPARTSRERPGMNSQTDDDTGMSSTTGVGRASPSNYYHPRLSGNSATTNNSNPDQKVVVTGASKPAPPQDALSGLAHMLQKLPAIEPFLDSLGYGALALQFVQAKLTPLSIAMLPPEKLANIGVADSDTQVRIVRSAQKLLNRCILKLDTIHASQSSAEAAAV